MLSSGMVLTLVLATEIAAPRPIEVAIELGALGAPAKAGGATAHLRELLGARLVQEGFGVVSVEQAPGLMVSVEPANGGCLIRAKLAAKTLERRVPECAIELAEDQLEIVQKATELVRAAEFRIASLATPLTRTTAAASVAQSSDREEPVLTSAPPLASPPRSGLASPGERGHGRPELSAGLGALIRSPHVDPFLRVGAALALRPWLGLETSSGVSHSTGGQLDVIEAELLVGPDVRWSPGENLRLEAALLGGGLLHHFSPANGSSNRFDPLALATVTGRLALSDGLVGELRVGVGLSRTQYDHVVDNEPVWSRTRFRSEVSLGLLF